MSGNTIFFLFLFGEKYIPDLGKNQEKWLEALYKGEEQAYKVLFDEYFYALSSFATKYLGEKEAAEDLVQEVLCDLWLHRQRFGNIISLKSYLYQIVRNRCLNVLKHQKVETRYFAEQTYKTESEFFLNQILEEEIYRSLKEALDSLPEQTRQIYDLTLLGHSNQEIADLLDLTLDAVKARKRRGKQLLQDKMKNLIFLVVLFRENTELR